MNLSYRRALKTDIEFLLWLRKETMNEHLAKAGFALNDKNHFKGLNYQFEDARIIYLNDQKIGLLKKHEHKTFIEIIQIQIAPEFQRKRIGERMIRSIISDAFKKNVAVQLSVLKDNQARYLYSRLGFNVVDENDQSFIMRIEKEG